MRPRAWRTIKFATPFYHIHVNPVVGAKDLLRELGYRRETERSLEFYEDTVPESDIPKVKQITAELLVAKLEMEGFDQKGLHPWQLLQPPHAKEAPPSVDMFGEDSLQIHGSDGQMSSAHTLPQGSHTSDILTAQPHSGTAEPYKVSVCIDPASVLVSTCCNGCMFYTWSSEALTFLIVVFVGKDIRYWCMLAIVSLSSE